MSLLVDNFPLELQAKLGFFHRRLCHMVENRERKTGVIFINIIWLQEKCEYLIQYYVSRHKCHFWPFFPLRPPENIKIRPKKDIKKAPHVLTWGVSQIL